MMSRMKEHGFTLLETMIALLILAMSLTALVEVQSLSTDAVIRSKHLTLVTELARGKMYDLIQEVRKKGFGEFEDTLECDFEEDGYSEIGCTALLRKVEIPIPEGGLFGSGQGDQEESELAGTDRTGMIQQAAESLLSMYSTMIRDMVSNAVRELTLTVTWKESGRERSFSVTTHLIDVMRAGGTGMPGGLPGFGPGGSLPGGKAGSGGLAPPPGTRPGNPGAFPQLRPGFRGPGGSVGWPK